MKPTDNIPKQYQTPQLLNYVNSLTPPQGGVNPNNVVQMPTQTPIVPTTQSPTITASSLKPATSLTVPSIPQNTIATGIAAQTQQRAQSDLVNAAAEAEALQNSVGSETEQKRNAFDSAVQGIFGQKANVQANQAAMEEQAGINEQRKALNDINTSIAEQQVAMRGELDKIRATPQSQSQAQVASNVVENDYGRRLADLAIRQSAARGNIQGIQEDADRKTKLLLAPIESQLEYFKTFGKDNIDYLTEKDNQKLGLITKKLEEQRADVKDLQKVKTDLLMEIANNNGGTDQNLISQINGASSIEDAVSLAAKSGYIGKLTRENAAFDRSIRQQQLDLSRAEFNLKKIASTGTTGQISEQANKLVSTGDPASNKAAIAALLSGDKVSSGTKGRLAPANEVMNAVEEFAANRQQGEFAGLGIGGRIKEGFKSLVNAESEASKVNAQSLAALDLKVQQWASGASLTEQQTKQVQKLVPQKTDSDSTIRTKMSGLYNYMANNVESGLLTDGININFKPVNLFETYDLLKDASPEQLQQLKDLQLIQ